MKTTKFFSALSLVLMIIGMSAVSSIAGNTIGGTGSANSPREVTFVVNIVQPPSLAGLNCNYYIVITNDRGVAVSKAQPFRPGQWSYTYYAAGPINGNLTARMVTDPSLSCLGAYYIPPSMQSGPFGPGRTYTFVLTPQKASSGPDGVH